MPCCARWCQRVRLVAGQRMGIMGGIDSSSSRQRLLTLGSDLVDDQRRKLTLHLGPLELSFDKGVRLQPKLNVGLEGPAFYCVAGLRDTRGGALVVEALALALLSVQSEGDSIASFLANVETTDKLPFFDVLIVTLPRVLGIVLEATGVDVEAASYRVDGRIFFYLGVGFTAGVYLGCWPDTDDYYSVGVEGTIASGIGVGFTIRVGLHRHGRAVRVTCFAGSAGFDGKKTKKTGIHHGKEEKKTEYNTQLYVCTCVRVCVCVTYISMPSATSASACCSDHLTLSDMPTGVRLNRHIHRYIDTYTCIYIYSIY